jgi:hypothetical protein
VSAASRALSPELLSQFAFCALKYAPLAGGEIAPCSVQVKGQHRHR